ncbi:intermembrane lipid transfer protein VPS13D-like isoform X2 [Mya arenaria]|uniref:intermembrane lipid transfer protein VPS13D-like isoform X2 n=1 Tax=Mya arenaria TaxID=6604 RepID=UPI0022E6BC1F|nr:intermembrane lipid transfer protein VPS13D-like isoform X2 [Mya arenaria]
MLEGLAAWVLNTYVGEYVENLNTDQLSIALLSGAVELENLPLKKDALSKLGLPLQVKSGFIGKIKLQIPVRRMHSEPWVISIERLYLVAGPLLEYKYDEEKEKAATEARKTQMLKALEDKMQIQKTYTGSSWFSYGTSVLANILENLQLNVSDVHLRYEDAITNPSCPFACGIVIKSLTAQSTDDSWTPKFVSRSVVDLMHKLVDLRDFSIYVDTNTTLVGDLPRDKMADSLLREMYISSITKQFKDHEYILSPVSASAKMKRHTTALPLRNLATPRNAIDLTLENMAFSVSEDQYRNIVLLLREFDQYEQSKRYRKWRPQCQLHKNAKVWWNFAIDAKLWEIHECNKRLTKSFLSQRCKDVVAYVKLYTAYMKKEFLDATMKAKQERIEKEFSFDELKILRELVYRNLRIKASKSPSPEPEKPKAKPQSVALTTTPSPPLEDKSILQRWFPGWGGWYGGQVQAPVQASSDVGTSRVLVQGSQDDSAGEPPPPKISKSELEQELEVVIDDVLGDGEDDKSILKRDFVFAQLNFCLKTGSLRVLGNSTNTSTEDRLSHSIMELECSAIKMLFESRPRNSGLTFGLSVGGLQLLDKMTEGTLFPVLIGCQNKERFGNKGYGGFQRGAGFTAVHEETDRKLFELKYEKNPLGTSANYRFSIHSEPLDIVYNKPAFKKVKEVFSSRNIHKAKKSAPTLSAARRQYETIKRQTQKDIKNTLSQILEGSKKVKRWEIELDVAAPLIILPETFTNDNTNMIVVDLGHMNCYNTRKVTPESESTGNNDDEFLTPMSTPPNELEEDKAQTATNLDTLSQLELTEEQFYSKLYENYTLELRDLQIMSGRMKDNWRHIHNRTTTPLHLLDRLSISLQLERRLIYTTDPQYPTVIASGEMPVLTLHVNEHKVQIINSCIASLSKVPHTPPVPNSMSLSMDSQVSLSASTSGLSLSEIGEMARDESIDVDEGGEDASVKLKELLEESKLLLVQFNINRVSLEIHSRDRPIAELQVCNVKSSLTKRLYDTSVSLTVHSLLVVDAIQTYGKDFELLMASHRNVSLDSTSGSIRDSAPTSPMAVSPPGSPMEHLPGIQEHPSGGLAAMHDVVSRAFQALISSDDCEPKVKKSEDRSHMMSPVLDSEALITVEYEMYAANSPSNKNVNGPLHVANFAFNNLDIIANQETVVEIVSFLKRISPRSSMPDRSVPTAKYAPNTNILSETLLGRRVQKQNKATSQTEVTAEFNRLSILLMRLEDGPERVSARKVATATMSAARLQATIDTRMTMSGSLGGFHVFDITPEAKRHQRVFSVGQDMSQSHIPHHVFVAPTLYQTANESVLDDLRDNSSKAFSFEFSKPLKNKSSRSCSPIFNRTSDDLKGDNCISVNLRVASLCYTHSPKCLQELSLCVSAFKEYKASVAKSLKSVASEVAKGIIAKRSEMSHPGNFGSGTSLDTIAKLRSNLSLDNTEMEYLENATILEDTEVQKNKIMIDASFDSPVIVIPKSASSSRVFVAHLGQISLSNKDDKAQIQFEDEKPVEDLIDKEEANPDRIFVEIRKMNLYSVDIDQKNEEKGKGAMGFDGPSAFRPVHVDTDKDTPIMYDTTVHVTIDHVSGDTLSGASNVDNLGDESFFPKDIESSFSQQDTQQPVMDIRAKIQTPLKLVLLKSVYEQILQTSDYLSSEKEANPDTPDSVKDAFDNKSDIVGGITDDTGGLESSKVSANSVSQGKLPFISKKLRFEVPLFNVEMRANLSDGEQGVVDIRLNRFLLDLTKDNPATTNVELSLKSIVMEDLLEAKDSPHRIIVMSKGPQREDPRHMKPHEFLSHSCPDNAIITPEPVMPGSLPSSFHSHLTHMNKPIMSRPLAGAFVSQRFNLDSDNKKNPRTPPPLVHMLRWASDDSLVDEHLVHISLVLVDVASPEFKEKYNEIKRFVDVDFSCLEVKINLQTWVVLLDFLGLGAKVADIDVLSGREPEVQSKPNDSDEYVQAVVNSEIKVKMERLSIILNKEEYRFAEASVSKLNANVVMRDGNIDVKGQLGKVSLLDLSPSGALYRERFMTVGEQALEFDFFKYGMPDPWCKRDYDMKLKMEMSSVRYTHTQRFAMEMLGFVQHFLQAQDVLGRIRAASAGKKINEAAFHQARLLLDIVAGSPIILIPHSSKSTDVLVADLGQLSVRNCFKLDGNDGTCTADQQTSTQKPVSAEPESAGGLLLRQPLSRSSSRTTQRSVSSTSVGSEAKNVDPMQQSLYGSLEHDMRIENSDESMDISEIGSSVDPQSPAPSAIGSQISLDPFSSRSRTSVSARSDSSGLDLMSVPDNSSPAPDTKKSGLNVFLSEAFNTKLFTTNPDTNEFIDEPSSLSDTTMKDNSNMTASSMTSQDEDKTMDTDAGPCLLDVMDVRLSAMDLFSAERVDKSRYSGTNLRQDLEFPSCVIQRKGYALLKEKCMLDLKIERNLDGDQSHAVPDVRVQGALSSVYCCLDVTQYKLIRGLLDHNLGEKIENFKKELLTYMQDPSIQTVLSGDVWTVISMGVDLHNVTLEFVTSHDLDPTDPSMSGVSLAKLDFIHSRLSYESFSDQSKETDLTSTEILISDTRFRDVATNQRTSVFEKILQPMKSESGRRLQLELHWRASQEGTTFSVVVNNMKLLCSFEWIMAVKEFIATKPENPFLYGQSLSNMSCASRSGATSPVTVSSVGSGATSPLSSTSMTSNTQQAQSDPPFELKLNVTETEFVVVENLSSLDTNAVILRCTAVLSYRPQSKDKILSCTLQSLEVFSCSLQAEEETALSIVDPVTIQVTMERNRNYTPVLRHSPMELGLSDTRVFGDKHLLLEVTLDDTMNVRLSYQDMQLFLAIWESLPKTLKSKPSAQSPTAVPSEYNIDKLEELGFSHSECANALETHNNNLNEAAYWLIENSKSSKQKKGEKKVTTIEVSVKTLCLCLIDDCLDADIPLVEMTFSGISLKFEPGNEGRARFGVMADYYNRTLSGWEPLLEQWKCHAQWRNFKHPEQKLSVEISASEVLNLTVTSTLLDLYNMTKDKWAADYYKHTEEAEKGMESLTSVKRRQLLRPYAIRNQTGSLLWFRPVTKTPSQVGGDNLTSQPASQDWVQVPPNEDVSFNFQRHEKIRHKKSQTLRMNQVEVRVDGWQTLNPLSVDKVGTFFRYATPDHEKQTIFVGPKAPLTRVVFDIAHEGTARKVITLRSALVVHNKLDESIELKMDNRVIQGRYETFIINSNQKRPIPISYINSRLWMKPVDWPVDFCSEPISWQHGEKGKIVNHVRTCSSVDSVYRFCVAVFHEHYPEAGQRDVLPGHNILIMAPFTVQNLLPVDLIYYFKGIDISGGIKPGKTTQVHAADTSKRIMFGIQLENFQTCREYAIESGDQTTINSALRLYDINDRLLELNIRILLHVSGSLKVIISSPYWLVNKSGLPLVFRQDGCQEAAGQGEETEMARVVSPLLFSFNESNSPYLCEMRLGKYKHGTDTVPTWCKGFVLKNDEDRPTVRQLNVIHREGNRPDWIYSIGIEVKKGQGSFFRTTIVTFSPRYRIDNLSEHKLAIAQRHFTCKETLTHPDGQLSAPRGSKMPFHWPRQDLDQLLCVRMLDVNGCNWSGGFKIDSVSSFHVNMRDEHKNSLLLKVELLLQGQTFTIVFLDAEETPPPFRIDNFSEMPLTYYQTKTRDENLRAVIRPNTCLPYAWDEPTLEHYLTLSVPSGSTETYNLDQIGEGTLLCYQSYFFISASATFSRENSFSDAMNSELVFDCEHDFVIFRKKEVGKRSQLWRMTPTNMLENEGMCQPLEPGKASRTGQRYVLDVADNKENPVLVVRKATEGKSARQRWTFREGMLCSESDDDKLMGFVRCVQCPGGIEQLQDGAMVILGMAQVEEGAPIPPHMRMSMQKMNPGSGSLAVRTQMDGPVRVVQINDQQHRIIRKTLSKDDDDWEIYEDSLNHKTNERRGKPQHRNVEFDLNLKGGVGISLVNTVPEELLYISLKNITLNYREGMKAVTFEVTVGNIQADNQLLGAMHTAMLFVTPTSKNDTVDNHHALWISAHRLPNMGWNAEIYKHLLIKMKKMSLQLDEVLLWKLIQYARIDQGRPDADSLNPVADDLNMTLSNAVTLKTKRYYFGILNVKAANVSLSVLKPAGGLSTELYSIKKRMGFTLLNFEDANVQLDEFKRLHQFDSKEFFLSELKKHYSDELRANALQILGSLDFLGNPAGFIQDVKEGVAGLVHDQNPVGLVKGVMHGISNTSAKMAGVASEALSNIHTDSDHNQKRQVIRAGAKSSGGQFKAGWKGFAHGMVGAFKGIAKPVEGLRKGGIEGFGAGLYQGVTGLVTKPLAGVLDLATGMSNAVKDVSKGSSHKTPDQVRQPRCCHGPGGLLLPFSKNMAKSQQLLYSINESNYQERLIVWDQVRSSSGSEDQLFVMITSHQVIFMRERKDSIILQLKHRDYSKAAHIETEGCYYVSLFRVEERDPYSSNKTPRVRCDCWSTAQKVAQQINYAKSLSEEQKMFVPPLPDIDDQYYV